MDLDPRQQAEIEHNERWLAAMMTPGPSAAAVNGARDAVRVAMNEQWLANVNPRGADTPALELLGRVKRAVRAELRRGAHGGTIYRVFGALSAAACIALAVAVVRLSMPVTRFPEPQDSIGEVFADAWDAVDKLDEFSDIQADVAWLETSIDAWASRPASRIDEFDFDSWQEQIDGVMSDAAESAGTS